MTPKVPLCIDCKYWTPRGEFGHVDVCTHRRGWRAENEPIRRRILLAECDDMRADSGACSPNGTLFVKSRNPLRFIEKWMFD